MQDMVPTTKNGAYPIMLDEFFGAGSIDAPYNQIGTNTQEQNECLPVSDTVQHVPWTTKYYAGMVDTPAYRGPVVQSEQLEGPCTPGTWCNHEIWSFAPGWGIVQIKDLSGGVIFNPPVINERIDDPQNHHSVRLHPPNPPKPQNHHSVRFHAFMGKA